MLLCRPSQIKTSVMKNVNGFLMDNAYSACLTSVSVVTPQASPGRLSIVLFFKCAELAQAASLMGGLVGPAVGGLLADAAGLRAPFTLTGCAALAAAVYGWVRLPETMGLHARTADDAAAAASEPAALRAAQAETLQVNTMCLPYFSQRIL